MRNAKAALRNAALRIGLAVLLLTALERDAPLRDEAAKLALTVGPGTTIAENVPSAAPPSRPGFLRLSLAGENVAWTKANNTHVKLSYAILTRDRSTRGAINCASMKPPAHALASSGISDAAFRSELQAAFAMWSLVAAVDFVETTDEAAADILFGAETEPSGHAFTNVTPAAPGSGRIAKALVCLSPGSRWKVGFDGNLSVFDVRYTLAHEIGHAIGLDHPSREGHLMSYRYVENRSGLSDGDRAGAIALYGPRTE